MAWRGVARHPCQFGEELSGPEPRVSQQTELIGGNAPRTVSRASISDSGRHCGFTPPLPPPPFPKHHRAGNGVPVNTVITWLPPNRSCDGAAPAPNKHLHAASAAVRHAPLLRAPVHLLI